MKIVVLDGYTLNPGDMNWEELRVLGDCQVYDRTSPADLVARAAGAGVILTNKVVLDAAALAALPALKYIGVLATGYNVVDVAAARQHGLCVTNIPAYSTTSVAQLVFAHALELAHHIGEHAAGVRAGRWSRSVDFCYWDTPLVELAGLTMGIVGFGQIGRQVARIADAFAMKVLAHAPRAAANVPAYVTLASLEDLLRQSDLVSLHCPLTPQTRELINSQRLAMMKPGAFLINTGRGALINEADLAAALNQGQLAGAGLDVLSSEPPAATNPLLAARNCLITPHIAWATRAARQRLMRQAVENLRAFLGGQAVNVVS